MGIGEDQEKQAEKTEYELDRSIRIPLFDAIPESAKKKLLAAGSPKQIEAGERLIRQGAEGDGFFIVLKGYCAVRVEREGVLHQVGRLGPGSIVGEMALLTGEKRNAHVDAETDIEVMAITRAAFDETCARYSQVRKFLTRLVTNRLSSALLSTDRTIGKYVIDKVIGEGGSSMVYHGIHSRLNMPVAIKMLKHEMAMEPEFFEQFRNEARVIAQLDHENILKVYDVEELYRTFFIIMEYVEGDSLKSVLRKEGKLSPSRTVELLLQICAGLGHAHEKGVVHSDVKPGNIVLHKNDRVKLVDFGFACAPGTRDEKNIKGTAYYVAPEQVKGQAVDERSDLYSLGIMAYEMMTGQRPCQLDDTIEILTWHLKQDVKDPRSVVADLPEELANLVIKATRRDPELRYRSVGQLVRDLQPVAEMLGITGGGTPLDQLAMTSLFLFYREEHQTIMQDLIREFTRELEKVGARLKGVNFKGLYK
jgi:CRP-like cAMP-binding protein